MSEQVILVDEKDNEIGVAEKMHAHRQGLLHRAISVFIYNSKGQMLLQKRAAEKYHSPSLWSNACCSHPRPGESTASAASRRLIEEMGIDTPLNYSGKFRYKTVFENGLTEHEVDHVYFAVTDQKPSPDPHEVEKWKYIELDQLLQELDEKPGEFTSWIKICLDKNLPGDIMKKQ